MMRLHKDDDDHATRQEDEARLVANEDGIIKYGIAYMLGVPVTLLVIIFLFARGC